MTILASILVALPFALTLYAYVIYPGILWLIGQTRVVPPRGTLPSPPPLVTIVIPAYNEEVQIRGAVDALLAQDYPTDRRQILVISDGSTDRTDAIVRSYASRGVELLQMAQRSGKTAAENASIPVIRGEVVINTDASIRLDKSATSRLVAQFSDPTVGVASSRDVSITRQRDDANTTEAGYVGYEMWLRSLETRAGGIVGASGSGYAIRLDLHRKPVRGDLSRDFSSALTAQKHGYRAVSVDDAICYVPRTGALKAEYRRKVRTISRGMETLLHNRILLDPALHGLFAWKLFSHKVCRWLVPLSLIPFGVGLSLLAWRQQWMPRFAAAVLMTAAVGAVGILWPERKAMPKPLSILVFGIAANAAVVHAAWRVLIGQHDHVWEPTRRASSPSELDATNGRSA